MARRPPQEISCTLPSVITGIEDVCLNIKKILLGQGLPEHCFAVELLAREFLTNAMRHGNELDPRKRVYFSLHLGRKWIRMEITDEGKGFHRQRYPHRPSADNTVTPGGRGLAIGTIYADRLRFNRAGNRVTLWINKIRKQKGGMAL